MKNTFLLLLFPMLAFSQSNQDCNTSLPLCNKDVVFIPATSGIGNVTDEFPTTACIQNEFSSTWFKWKMASTGILTFSIVPDSITDDLDFAVFKLNSWDDCENKTLVRCVAAGENIGEPFANWAICAGPTGLAFNETDMTEAPGCNNGNNNFAAPLDAVLGDIYALVVNNFSNSGGGFYLDFCDDGISGCASINCDGVLAGGNVVPPKSGIAIWPNPVSSDALNIRSTSLTDSAAKVWFSDLTGRILHPESHFLTNTGIFDVSELLDGVYTIFIQTGKGIESDRFVVKR